MIEKKVVTWIMLLIFLVMPCYSCSKNRSENINTEKQVYTDL